MVEAADSELIYSKRKAISALLLYADQPERHGRYMMLDPLLHALRASSGCMVWNRVIPTLFNETSPLTVVLLSPHVDWLRLSLEDGCGNLVSQWVVATLEVLYTEEIGRSVVDVLLQVSPFGSLRSHVPINVWSWLEKQPPLPPDCRGRSMGTEDSSVRHVRSLGDINILKSYFLLVWSEWDCPWSCGFSEMCTSIREDFRGISMCRHRGDLVKRLDYVMGQLDRESGHLRKGKPWLFREVFQDAKTRYKELKEILLEVDGEAMCTLAGTPPKMTKNWPANLCDIHRIPPGLDEPPTCARGSAR